MKLRSTKLWYGILKNYHRFRFQIGWVDTFFEMNFVLPVVFFTTVGGALRGQETRKRLMCCRNLFHFFQMSFCFWSSLFFLLIVVLCFFLLLFGQRSLSTSIVNSIFSWTCWWKVDNLFCLLEMTASNLCCLMQEEDSKTAKKKYRITQMYRQRHKSILLDLLFLTRQNVDIKDLFPYLFFLALPIRIHNYTTNIFKLIFWQIQGTTDMFIGWPLESCTLSATMPPAIERMARNFLRSCPQCMARPMLMTPPVVPTGIFATHSWAPERLFGWLS